MGHIQYTEMLNLLQVGLSHHLDSRLLGHTDEAAFSIEHGLIYQSLNPLAL